MFERSGHVEQGLELVRGEVIFVVLAIFTKPPNEADPNRGMVVAWAVGANAEHIPYGVDGTCAVYDEVVANFEEAHLAALPTENIKRAYCVYA